MDDAKEPLTANAVTVLVPLVGLWIVEGSGLGTAFLLGCYAIGLAGILFCAWRAAKGSEQQLIRTPVTGMLLCAVLAKYDVSSSPTTAVLIEIIVAVAIGVPIMAGLLKGRDARVLMIAGLVAGGIGFVLFAAAYMFKVPGYGLFVPWDQVITIDPLGIASHRFDSEFMIYAQRIVFYLQAVVVAAWDSLIIAVFVGLVGLVVSPLVRVVSR